jgi:hypothetical protein
MFLGLPSEILNTLKKQKTEWRSQTTLLTIIMNRVIERDKKEW